MSGIVQRPPVSWYEVRTKRSEAYWAEGDVIERGDGWLTLWADEGAIALSVPLDDIAAIRRVSEDERSESEPDAPDDGDPGPEEPPEPTENEQLRDRVYTAERALSRIREALGTETPVDADLDYQKGLLADARRELAGSEAARDKLRRDRERLRALLANENPTAAKDACCVCGSTDVAYRNYRQQPFCEPCADGRPPGEQAVRALHQRGTSGDCAECSVNACAHWVPWPCGTILALDGDTTSKEQT